MPLPAPCTTANHGANPAPSSSRPIAATGCASAARRAASNGCARRRNPNSASRAATCAGPISAPAATAAASPTPAASSNRGRCAAIDVLLNQPIANTVASSRRGNRALCAYPAPDVPVADGPDSVVRGAPSCSSASRGCARGRLAFNGNATSKCSAAQPRHASRQPNSACIQADSGQPTVLAKPAINVIPVIELRAAWP